MGRMRKRLLRVGLWRNQFRKPAGIAGNMASHMDDVKDPSPAVMHRQHFAAVARSCHFAATNTMAMHLS